MGRANAGYRCWLYQRTCLCYMFPVLVVLDCWVWYRFRNCPRVAIFCISITSLDTVMSFTPRCQLVSLLPTPSDSTNPSSNICQIQVPARPGSYEEDGVGRSPSLVDQRPQMRVLLSVSIARSRAVSKCLYCFRKG